MSSIAPFVSSSEEDIKRMLKISNLKKGEILYDLGSGDGRILIAAVKNYDVKAVGIEIREDLVKETLNKIRDLGLQEDIKVICGDLLKSDVRNADVVTLYLTNGANEKLSPRLIKYLKPGVRIVSHRFEIPNWNPLQINTERPHKIYLYVM